MKKTEILAIIALLLGIASPLPIWPGPILFRHLPPGIISFALILLAYFTSKEKGSKVVGTTSLIYGVLAILAGGFFLTISITATSIEFRTIMLIVIVGSIVCLVAGIVAIILGYKLWMKAKK